MRSTCCTVSGGGSTTVSVTRTCLSEYTYTGCTNSSAVRARSSACICDTNLCNSDAATSSSNRMLTTDLWTIAAVVFVLISCHVLCDMQSTRRITNSKWHRARCLDIIAICYSIYSDIYRLKLFSAAYTIECFFICGYKFLANQFLIFVTSIVVASTGGPVSLLPSVKCERYLQMHTSYYIWPREDLHY